MLPIDPAKTDEFKARISFDALPRGGTAGVVLQWPKPGTLEHLDAARWDVEGPTTAWVPPEGAMAQWALRDSGSRLQMLVFVSSYERRRAQQLMVDVASQTMMARVEFDPIPNTGLGDICIGYMSNTTHDLMWVRHNVVIRLWLEGQLFDTMPLAKELDELARLATVRDLAAHRPIIRNIRVSRVKLRVGETLDVQVDAIAGGRTGRPVDVQFSFPEPVVAERIDGGFAQFSAEAPGNHEIVVAVVEPTTLMSEAQRIAIEVTPADSDP